MRWRRPEAQQEPRILALANGPPADRQPQGSSLGVWKGVAVTPEAMTIRRVYSVVLAPPTYLYINRQLTTADKARGWPGRCGTSLLHFHPRPERGPVFAVVRCACCGLEDGVGVVPGSDILEE